MRVGLECAVCSRRGEAKDGASNDFVWCRDCGRTLCRSCAEGPGHGGGHRWAAWQDWDVLKSTALGFEARLDRRARLAAREEKALKEFLAEVQARLLGRLQREQGRRDEADRRRVAALSRAMGDESGVALSTPPGGPPALDRTLTDADLARMCNESLKVEPSLAGPLLSEPLADSPILPDSSFALLPPSFTPRAFINLLEEALRRERRLTPNPLEDVDVSFDSRGSALNVSTSTPLDTDGSRPSSRQFNFPLEPQVNVSNISRQTPELRTRPDTSVDSRDSGKAVSVSDSRNGRPGFRAHLAPGLTVREPSAGRLSGSVRALLHDPARQSATKETPNTGMPINPSLPVTSTPTPSLDGSDEAGSSAAVDAFHFGSDFLGRPIDVEMLPGDRIAVSDSYGGVFVLSRSGSLLQQISTEGASASSLSYCRGDGRLYVSLLTGKGTRLLRAFQADTYGFIEDLKAPTLPVIDNTRTRWVATSSQGDVYLVTGDGKRSAVWKLSPLSDSWITVADVAGPHRYQYLQVVEESSEPDNSYHVLLTVDGLSGGVLLLVVDIKGHLLGEYDLAQLQRLSMIRSPAAAVVDAEGNLLMVDYNDGKLWIQLKRGSKESRLRVLTELGPKGALGLAVSGGWAYLACLGKPRVQALHYKDLLQSSTTRSNTSNA